VLAAQYRVVDDRRVSVTSPFQSNYDAIRRKWGVSAEDGAGEQSAQPDEGQRAAE
jgi:hypothetical protein